MKSMKIYCELKLKLQLILKKWHHYINLPEGNGNAAVILRVSYELKIKRNVGQIVIQN